MRCEVIDKFFDTVNAVNNEQKTPWDYGTGHLVYHSEINLLDIIHGNPDLKATEIAKAMGITKGAVTHTIAKLTNKGFVESYMETGNKKEKHYKLTETGKAVREGHCRHHKDANNEICKYLSALSPKEKKTILAFLTMVKDCIPFSIVDCQNSCSIK